MFARLRASAVQGCAFSWQYSCRTTTTKLQAAFQASAAPDLVSVDVLVIGAGPAGLAAAHGAIAGANQSIRTSGTSVLVVEAGRQLSDRDRCRPDDAVAGCGGAGAWSDGKFSFYPSASSLWNLPDRSALRCSYDWMATQLRDCVDAEEEPFPLVPEYPSHIDANIISETSADASLAVSPWQSKRYPSIYIGQQARERMVHRLCQDIGPISTLEGFQDYLRSLKSSNGVHNTIIAPLRRILVQTTADAPRWETSPETGQQHVVCGDGGYGRYAHAHSHGHWAVPLTSRMDGVEGLSDDATPPLGLASSANRDNDTGSGTAFRMEVRARQLVVAGGRVWPLQDTARLSRFTYTATSSRNAQTASGTPVQLCADIRPQTDRSERLTDTIQAVAQAPFSDSEEQQQSRSKAVKLRSHFRRLEFGARVVGIPSAPLFSALASHQLDPKLILRRRVRVSQTGEVEVVTEAPSVMQESRTGQIESKCNRVLHENARNYELDSYALIAQPSGLKQALVSPQGSGSGKWLEGEVEWRTFCFCRAGDVVEAESDGRTMLSGRADLTLDESREAARRLAGRFGVAWEDLPLEEMDGLHNMGFNVRVLSDDLAEAVGSGMRVMQRGRTGGNQSGSVGQTTHEMQELGDSQRKAFYVRNPEDRQIDSEYGARGAALLRLGLQLLGEANGGTAMQWDGSLLGLAMPTLEGVGWYPDAVTTNELRCRALISSSADARTGPITEPLTAGCHAGVERSSGQPEGPEVWVAGDASGDFRGIVGAMVSGYYVGMKASDSARN